MARYWPAGKRRPLRFFEKKGTERMRPEAAIHPTLVVKRHRDVSVPSDLFIMRKRELMRVHIMRVEFVRSLRSAEDK